MSPCDSVTHCTVMFFSLTWYSYVGSWCNTLHCSVLIWHKFQRKDKVAAPKEWAKQLAFYWNSNITNAIDQKNILFKIKFVQKNWMYLMCKQNVYTKLKLNKILTPTMSTANKHRTIRIRLLLYRISCYGYPWYRIGCILFGVCSHQQMEIFSSSAFQVVFLTSEVLSYSLILEFPASTL